MISVAAIILAAGRSIRMGRPKMLLPLGGGTVIGRVVGEAGSAGLSPIVVVTRAGDEAVARAAGPGATIVPNPEPGGDMLSSVRCGLAAVGGECSAVVVALGDQPSIRAGLIGRLIAAMEATGRGIVVPVHAGRRGHPILIRLGYRDEIMARFDGEGLRGLLAAHRSDVHELESDDPRVLDDMDTPEDYAREAGRDG